MNKIHISRAYIYFFVSYFIDNMYSCGNIQCMQTSNELITDPKVSAELPHKYLGILGMIWVTILVINIFTALKTFYIGEFVFAVIILTYPLVYIFADIFTEVYGYRVTRKVVWTGFACMLLSSIIAYLYTLVPSPTFSENDAYNLIFKSSPIVALVIVIAFFCGELTNSFIVAKMKLWTNGKYLQARLILSTLFGQLVDNGITVTGIFYFAGWFESDQIVPLIVSTVILCTAWEILALPVTKVVIRFIKHKEGVDAYDHGTNFNPFVFSNTHTS